MKKILTLLLVTVMVLSLFGCAASQEKEPAVLKVGYAMENVTPDYQVGLGGYSDAHSRGHTSVLDPVYVICVAATYGEDTVLTFVMDMGCAPDSFTGAAVPMIANATGVKEENIIITATHTHSAPSLTGGIGIDRYRPELMGYLVTAAQKAMEDRAAATISTGVKQIEGLNFVRNYIMSDGKFEDDTMDTVYAKHCTDSDNRMVLVKFDREEKKDILLVNWQAHPDHAHQNGYNAMSADYPGALRNYVAEETEMLVAFIPGASGNQNPGSKIQSEKHGLKMNQYGKKLGQYAVEALADLKQVGSEGISVTRKVVDTQVDHSLDHLAGKAAEAYRVFEQQGLAAGNAKAAEYGFKSAYHARAVSQRKNMGPTKSLTLHAWRIGDVGFTSGMYEMFSDSGLYIRENASFETVMICQGNYSYIASEYAFDYKTYEAITGYYAKGTAEMLAKEFVSMLDTVK